MNQIVCEDVVYFRDCVNVLIAEIWKFQFVNLNILNFFDNIYDSY